MEGNGKCLNITLGEVEKKDTMKNNLSINSKGNELLNNKKSGYKNNIKKKKKKIIKENNGNEQNKCNGTLTVKNEENDSKVFKTQRNKRNSKNDNMEKHKNDVTENEKNDVIKHFKNDNVDIIWEKMVLLAIGEEFSLIDLCGLQLCIRDNEMFFKIWMKNYSNYLKNILMKKLKDLLGLPHNTSLVIRNLSNVYNNKKNQQGKEKNEKAKKNYNKNNKGVEFVASKKDSLKMHNYPNIVPPPNYLGNYNVYKYNLDMNLFYLYNNQNVPNPYIYIPVNIPSNPINNIYPDYMYDSNMSYPIDIFNNNLLSNDINVPSNFVNNKINGSSIIDKKKKIDYGLKNNEDYKKKYLYSLNSNDIYEDSKSSTCIKSVYTDDEYEYNNSSNNNNSNYFNNRKMEK
ncbi:conserved Plasmodium protein, unknown function [Plasmodium sp. gorilla clade G3]|nr:conserved Plasmodium protein, unknown function [Plasmodium sp. gorilla clade G3]